MNAVSWISGMLIAGGVVTTGISADRGGEPLHCCSYFGFDYLWFRSRMGCRKPTLSSHFWLSCHSYGVVCFSYISDPRTRLHWSQFLSLCIAIWYLLKVPFILDPNAILCHAFKTRVVLCKILNFISIGFRLCTCTLTVSDEHSNSPASISRRPSAVCGTSFWLRTLYYIRMAPFY